MYLSSKIRFLEKSHIHGRCNALTNRKTGQVSSMLSERKCLVLGFRWDPIENQKLGNVCTTLG